MLTLEEKKLRASEVVRALEERYPDATCALQYEGDPWRLLVMGRLSAQCTDARVNVVCEELFRRFPDAAAMANAPIGEIESTICKLFERVIGIERVGRHDNYYDLGGTSLNMMELLCEAPLDTLTPSEFMQDPTPAGLAKFVINRSAGSLPVPLYTPQDATAAFVLFPYGGGDAAAYTALVAEFRKRNASCQIFMSQYKMNILIIGLHIFKHSKMIVR